MSIGSTSTTTLTAALPICRSALAHLSVVIGVTLGHLPRPGLIGLLALVIAVPASIGAYRYAEDVKKLMPYMGMNVIINIVTPVLVAVGCFVG